MQFTAKRTHVADTYQNTHNWVAINMRLSVDCAGPVRVGGVWGMFPGKIANQLRYTLEHTGKIQ